MHDFPLTGAQKTFLRGRGQTLEPVIKVGKAGLTPEFFKELQKQLGNHELIKLRFVGIERDQRTQLTGQIVDEGQCLCIGTVGHTALFYRHQSDPTRRLIELP
jgi:RNA-binding protein